MVKHWELTAYTHKICISCKFIFLTKEECILIPLGILTMLVQLWLLSLGRIGIFQTDSVQFCFMNDWDRYSCKWTTAVLTVIFWRKHYSISQTESFTFVFNLHWLKGITLEVNASWSTSHCSDWNNVTI